MGIILNGVNHVAAYKGGTEIGSIYKGSTQVWQRAADNLLLPNLIAGQGTLSGITLVLNEDKSVSVSGTATGNVNAKISNGVELNSQRPAAWDDESIPGITLAPVTLGAEIVSGSVASANTDCCNLTLRYSALVIFLNCKIGDGMYNIDGTPTDPITQMVLYIKQGATFTDFCFRPYARFTS